MNIIFIGQTKFLAETALSRRIQALSEQLFNKRWSVEAYSSSEKHIRTSGSARIRHAPSLNPDRYGGMLYTVSSLIMAALKRPNVIHLTSWRAASLTWLAAFIAPQTTLVLTISSLPKGRFWPRMVLRQATYLCDAITVPTRGLQWQILNSFGILLTYIPDGYEEFSGKDIPVKTFGPRKGQYMLVLPDSVEDLRLILKSYKEAGSRKRLVVPTHNKTPQLARMEKRHDALTIVEIAGTRPLLSLARQAAGIFLARPEREDILLQAMDKGVPIASTVDSLYQELTGTTVPFVELKDNKHMAELLKGLVKGGDAKLIRAAKKRVKTHFTWDRIFEDYETLYHYPLVELVPLDSIRRVRFTEPAV